MPWSWSEKDRRTDAIAVLRQAAALAPGEADIRNRLFELSLAIVEQQLRSGSADAALSTAAHLLEEDPSRCDRIAAVGCSVAAEAPDAGLRAVELAAGVSMAQHDWAAAAAAMQAFAAAAPNPTPALMRLVEICVDGGLEEALPGAQAQLADAYLAAGYAGEARFIAEDLVARDPTDPPTSTDCDGRWTCLARPIRMRSSRTFSLPITLSCCRSG